MQPKESNITITDNKNKIIELLNDLVLSPRLQALKWAQITKQTPNMKIGYPGQHLASLVTGMPGTRTGARGHDLSDGSETKSCSRVDQVDKCMDCDAKVMRLESICPECNSANIKHNNDSKWLFTIRSQSDLDLLIKDVPRVILALADYPNLEAKDFETVSFKIYEIWPQNTRHSCFAELMKSYYELIYLVQKQNYPNKTPAPKNFWPDSYQFYKCNPVLTFSAIVTNANTFPKIQINTLIAPNFDRQMLTPVAMPSQLLSADELVTVISAGSDEELTKCLSPTASINELRDIVQILPIKKNKLKDICKMLPFLNEALRKPLSLRDTNKPLNFIKKHVRG